MSGRLKLKVQLMLGDDVGFGPGKAQLLEAIGAHGSISAAGRAMGVSYRRAWQMVETLNRCFKAPLVEKSAGGAQGGGARLTQDGRAVLEAYRDLTGIVSAEAEKRAGPLLARMAD